MDTIEAMATLLSRGYLPAVVIGIKGNEVLALPIMNLTKDQVASIVCRVVVGEISPTMLEE